MSKADLDVSVVEVKVKSTPIVIGARRLISAGAYLRFLQYSMKRVGVFLLPLDGILVHQRLHFVRLFPKQFPSSHFYTWVERGTVRVKCFA